MKILVILFLFCLSCTSVTRRDLDEPTKEEIAKYKPQQPIPVRIFFYGDNEQDHFPSYIDIDFLNKIKNRLLELGYASEVEVVAPKKNQLPQAILKSNDSAKSQVMIITLFKREIKTERSVFNFFNAFGFVFTLGIIPFSETSQYILGVKIESSDSKTFNSIYRNNVNWKTSSILYPNYKRGLLDQENLLIDTIILALIDFTKNRVPK